MSIDTSGREDNSASGTACEGDNSSWIDIASEQGNLSSIDTGVASEGDRSVSVCVGGKTGVLATRD